MINVKGHTDLPEGSKIIVSVGIKVKNDNDQNYAGDGEAEVDATGKWVAAIETPSAPEFSKEPHEVDASWTPVAERPEIIALTGSHGEKLKGKNAHPLGTNSTWFRIEQTINLKTKPKIYAFPSKTQYPDNSPEGAVVAVLWDWKNHAWSRMSGKVQDVFDPSRSHKLEMCKAHFDFWDVHGAKIISVDNRGNLAEVTVHVQASLGDELKEEDQRWIVLRLDRQNNPSESGTWGVNIEAVGPAG